MQMLIEANTNLPLFEPYKENNLFLKTIENIPNTTID